MFGSTVLEVAIGLVFVYLVLGLLCSTINEQISQFLSLRANNLWESICALLGDPGGSGAAKALYDHQLIRGLAVQQGLKPGDPDAHPADRPMPSYIPASTFALAVHDLKTNGNAVPAGGRLDQALKPLYAAAGADVDKARGQIEDWYNGAMARASGWYKRKVQINIFVIALLLVTAINADTLMLFNKLWTNPNERTALATRAETAAKSDISAIQPSLPSEATNLLGWVDCTASAPCGPADAANAMPLDGAGWCLKVLGLLLSAYAASLGAPFWFDLLKKIINMRSGVQSGNGQSKAASPEQSTLSNEGQRT